MDAAEYKHLVLGLIFVKYISDTFSAKRIELTRRFADPADDYFVPGSAPELLMLSTRSSVCRTTCWDGTCWL